MLCFRTSKKIMQSPKYFFFLYSNSFFVLMQHQLGEFCIQHIESWYWLRKILFFLWFLALLSQKLLLWKDFYKQILPFSSTFGNQLFFCIYKTFCTLPLCSIVAHLLHFWCARGIFKKIMIFQEGPVITPNCFKLSMCMIANSFEKQF